MSASAEGPGNFARWALKLLNPALRTIAVSSMLNANAAFGSLALELCESIPLYLSSLPTTRTSFNGKRKLNRPVHLMRKFPPASIQIENMSAIYSKCLLSETASLTRVRVQSFLNSKSVSLFGCLICRLGLEWVENYDKSRKGSIIYSTFPLLKIFSSIRKRNYLFPSLGIIGARERVYEFSNGAVAIQMIIIRDSIHVKTKRCPVQFAENYLFQFRKCSIVLNRFQYYATRVDVGNNPENSAWKSRSWWCFQRTRFCKSLWLTRNNIPGARATRHDVKSESISALSDVVNYILWKLIISKTIERARKLEILILYNIS